MIQISTIRCVDAPAHTKWIIDQFMIWIIDPIVKGVKQCQDIVVGMLWARRRRR